MEAEDLQVGSGELLEQCGYPLGVDAELLRASTHPHAGTLDLEVGVDPNRDPRPESQAVADGDDPLGLGLRLHLDRDPGRHRLGQLGGRLARAGEADALTAEIGVSRAVRISNAEATSIASTSPLRCCTTAGIGLALTA